METIETIDYEQCPFDWEHVSQIYLWMQTPPPEDGAWLEWVSGLGAPVRYRVKDGYFQFFSGDPNSSLFQEALQLEPMRTEDDAEWTIEKHGEGEYLVRTVFTQTFGPVDMMQRVDELLGPHGLWLENCETHASGAATFSVLESEVLRDACDRLTVLEAMCIKANKTVTELLTDYWVSIADSIESGGPDSLAPHRSGAKRRVPLLPQP